jgi:DNA-binding beta-propeller fold protein YncE
VRAVSTGGRGSGGTLDPLMSQDSLVQSAGGWLLLAVNAGSNDVSVLRADGRRLRALSVTPSRGTFPTSIAQDGDLVYVLNARGVPNISGFWLTTEGRLVPVAGGVVPLPGGATAMPTDIRFSRDGTRLVVTESGTGQIDIFEIDDDGRATLAGTQPSSGLVPFGFKFPRSNIAVVTEAGTGSVSSYRLTDDDTLQVISAAVPNGEMATCWISITRSGRYAYVSNTRSATLSSYHIATDGTLTLLDAVAAATGAGSAPIDSALSSDSRFLYVVDSTLGRLLFYRADRGDLQRIGRVRGLPTSIQGIVAR